MQGGRYILVVIAAISALSAAAAEQGASFDDGTATFERRQDTMKHLGRPLYLGIGRVVKTQGPLRPGYG